MKNDIQEQIETDISAINEDIKNYESAVRSGQEEFEDKMKQHQGHPNEGKCRPDR
jgi:hypothetical protein